MHNSRARTLLALLVLATGIAPARASAQASLAAGITSHNDYASPENWLCHARKNDACDVDLTTTVISAHGELARENWKPDANAPIDCFYVYPTVSGEETPNSDMAQNRAEINVIRQQFARFGSKCRTYAPMYRQVTLAGLGRILAPRDSTTPVPLVNYWAVAYSDVLDAWRYYMAHDNNGRGVVLIGHSQGSIMLTQLIREEIDGKAVQAKVVSVILAGQNIAVPKDRDVGGTFQHLPLCHAASQTGCLIIFATFRSTAPPPPHPQFGNITAPGMVSACTNPAALAGGSGDLHVYFATNPRQPAVGPESKTWVSPPRPMDTPFVSLPGLVSATCASNENSSGYLELTVNPPVSRDRTAGIGGDLVMGDRPMPTWGSHTIDMNVTLGNLIDIVSEQSRAYLAKPR